MKDKAKINKEEAVAEKPFTVRGEVYEWAQSLITALVICILVLFSSSDLSTSWAIL